MGECVVTWERMALVNQKSDTSHTDNDWLSMIWSINDKVFSKTIPLVNTVGDVVLHTGDILRPYQDFVVCQPTDTVTVVYAVINLGSYDYSKQAEAAARFTQGVLDTVAPIYLEAAAIVLGVVASGGFGAPEAIEQLAGGSSPLLDQLSSKIGGLIDTAFDKVITPLLKDIVEFFAEILSGHPNCNGEVFHDYVIFLPNQPGQDLHISKTYDGPQTNSSCGHAPRTKVDIAMHREGISLPQPDWRFCNKCQELFYDGSSSKGNCPAGGTPNGHLAAGYNFVLPHDSNTGGQAEWRFCRKCRAMFYNGYPEKGACPGGGAHEAAGYNFTLPHDVAGPGQNNWRYCANCHAMFYDGYPSKGVCPAAHLNVITHKRSGHLAQGYNFVLGHK